MEKQSYDELLNKSIATVLNANNDYHDLIKDAVTEYLKHWDYAELHDLLYEGSDNANV